MLDLDEVDVQGRTALVELNMEHIEVMLLPKDEYGALSSSSSLAEKEGAAERGGEEEEAAVGAVRPDCWWRIPPQQTGVMHRPLQRPRRRQRSPRGPGRERPRIRRRRRRYDPAHGPVRTTNSSRGARSRRRRRPVGVASPIVAAEPPRTRVRIPALPT
jgi:hypothetical protein